MEDKQNNFPEQVSVPGSLSADEVKNTTAPSADQAPQVAPKQAEKPKKKDSKKKDSKKKEHGKDSKELMQKDRSELNKLERRRVRKLRRLALIMAMLILLAAVAALAIWGIFNLRPADASIQGQADCEVVRVSGKLTGRLVELYVKEGDYVHKGQRLAKIYSSTADASLSKAKEMKKVASIQTQKVENGTRAEIIQAAQKVVEQAQAAEEISRKTYERLNNLFEEGVVSEQKRDEAKAALDASTAAVATAQSQLDLARNGAQAEDKEATRGLENVAEASVKEVEAILEDEYLIAPCDGEISNIYPHVGELVITGSPILTISQLDDMWVAFNVREEKLNDLPVGKEINVSIPALDNKETQLKVFYVHDMGSYATWTATKAYGDYDSKTFEVKARPLNEIPNFRPGMSVILK